jgi:chromosome segregation ATPase
MDEEVVLLEEQLAAAHADIERLETRLAEVEAQAATRETEIGGLRRDLEAARGEIAEREAVLASHAAEIDSLHAQVAEADERSRLAAARYREAVLEREPELPADLVGGETVEAVEESLTRARDTVAQVRRHIEEQAQAARVPAGAPVRGAPDLSGLSAAEKIRAGLEARE